MVIRPSRKPTFFHPDCPSSYPLGGAVLQTSTGVCFRFPLDLLSAHSGLFANAAEMSSSPSLSSSSNSGNDQMIPLELVDPDGLHVILSVLHPITPYHTEETKTGRLRAMGSEQIGEGFRAAERLDMPNLAELLLPYFADPFMRFAIASGSLAPPLLQATAVETFPLEFQDMSYKAEQVLAIVNTSCFDRLRRLHLKRRELPRSLLAKLMVDPAAASTASTARSGDHDFTKACRNTECPAYRSVKGRSWSQLRHRAASELWDVLLKTRPNPSRWRELSDWVLKSACRGCPACHRRLSDCFLKVLKDAESRLPVEL